MSWTGTGEAFAASYAALCAGRSEGGRMPMTQTAAIAVERLG